MSVTFADIKTMLHDRPALAWEHEAPFRKILDDLEKQGIVFSAEEKTILGRYAAVQNKIWPHMAHPRVSCYASTYGDHRSATQETVKKLSAGDHAITRLSALANADLRVYELDLETPVPATGLTETEAAHAVSYGLMAIDEHVDCLVIGSISAGADAVWKKLKTANDPEDVLVLLARHAGHDICAVLGAALAARMAKIPVLCHPACHSFLSVALTALTGETESVLLPVSDQALTWPEPLSALRQLNALKLSLAAGPQPAKNLTSISRAA